MRADDLAPPGTRVDGAAGAVTTLPEHVVELPGLPGWWVWRCMALRSGGFPAHGVDILRDEGCVAAALAVEAAEAERARALAAARAAVAEELSTLRDGDGWTDLPRRSVLLDARRTLRAGRVPERIAGEVRAGQAVAALRAAGVRAADARRRCDEAHAQAMRRTSDVLAELAADPRLCEAILWQNRGAYHTAVLRLRRGRGRDRKRRIREELLVRYWQRYTVKNDTIGFFGPMGWAWLDEGVRGLSGRFGEVVGERLLFFEQWAVDAVADVLAAQPGLDPWLAPRRLPFAHLDGTTLYPLDGPPLQLGAAEAAVLAACDGRQPAHALAADLVAARAGGLGAAEDVYRCLDDLRRRGLVVWRLEAPYTSRPEVALRATLEGVGDPELRARSLRTLDVLEAARDGVARAAGDPERLDTALGVMNTVFERLTGQPAVRGHGRMHVGRAVLYEDCVRDMDVRVGTDLLGQAGPALALVLQSARWLTRELAAGYHTVLHRLYRDLAGGGGAARVPLARLWSRLPEHFGFLSEEAPEDGPVLRDARRRLQEGWTQVLGLDEATGRQLRLASDDLRDRVARAFPADAPGWPHARYMSIDLFLSAPSLDAIAAGDHSFVLGELHLANNTLAASDDLALHPDPARMLTYPRGDRTWDSVFSVPSRRWRGMTSRTRDALQLPTDWHVLVSHEFPSQPVEPSRQLLLAELVVEPRGDDLVVRSYDGRFEREIVEFFGELISITVVDGFRVFAGRPYVPRITIDRVVVQRESWSFPVGEVAFAVPDAPEERFRQAVAWARRLGMPERVFVSLPLEQKPVHVDFASPILVENAARMLRRVRHEAASARVGFSEMLPGLDDLWLSDPQGRRYTSEFRIVALDRG